MKLDKLLRMGTGKLTEEDLAGMSATEKRESNKKACEQLMLERRELEPAAHAEKAEARRLAKETNPQARAVSKRLPKAKAAPPVDAEVAEPAAEVAEPAAEVFEAVAVPFSLEQFPTAEKIADGIFYVPRMLQQLGIDPASILAKLVSLPVVAEGGDIQLDFDTPLVVDGAADALRYRGNKLPRKKIFVQSEPQKGLRRYGYTGWQWAIARATKSFESVPEILQVVELTNSCTTVPKFNAGIGTLYDSGEDYIGEHSDKMPDLAEHSWITIYRTGPPRVFQITLGGKIFWSGMVGGGDALWMSLEANGKFKHALPAMSNVGQTGSLVLRSVHTCLAWTKVETEIAKAEKKKAPKQGQASQTVQEAPMQAAPVQEAPMQAAPVEAASMEAAPVQAAPVRPKGYIGSMMAFVKPAQK